MPATVAFLIALSAHASDFDLWFSLFRSQAILVGETHKRLESLDLVRRVIGKARAEHRCVTLALEISSDQQPLLDAVRQGRRSVREVDLWPEIDHPGYRQFLEDVLQRSAAVPCFRVIAADLPATRQGSRDAWMAMQIRKSAVCGTFVVGLFGSLHTVRGIRYRDQPSERNLADRLTGAHVSYRVLGQDWRSGCQSQLSAPASRAMETYLQSIRDTINGVVIDLPQPGSDAIQTWCGSR